MGQEHRDENDTPRRLGPAGGLLLFALALAVLLPGIQVSWFDRDEGWYAQVCREMLATGDWLVPRYLGEVWLAKPPLTYWLVTTSYWCFGVGEWQARLVPVLLTAVNVVLVGALGARLFGRRVGVLAGVLFITAGLPAVVGKMLLTDQAMLTCTLAAVSLHWRVAERVGGRGSSRQAHQSPERERGGERARGRVGEGVTLEQEAKAAKGQRNSGGQSDTVGRGGIEGRSDEGGFCNSRSEICNFKSEICDSSARFHLLAAGYWLAIGFGILSKGPATLVFAGAFGLALLLTPGRRTWILNWRFWAWMPAALLVAVPWYAHIACHEWDQFSRQFLGYEITERIAGTPHGHGGPPGYYVLLSLAGLLPWTVFVPGTIIIAFQRRREDRRLWLLLVWLAVPWVVLELIHSKLPHYILPLYVPLTILMASLIEEGIRSPRPLSAYPRNERAILRLWPAILFGVGMAIIGGAVLWWDGQWGWAAVASGAVLVVGFTVVARLLTRSFARAFVGAVVATVAFHLTLGTLFYPSLEPYRLSRNLAERMNAVARPSEQIRVCGYEEPSTFFYLDAPGRPVKIDAVPDLLDGQSGPALLAITQRELDRGPEREGLSPEMLARLQERLLPEPVEGFNYVKMSQERIWLARIGAIDGQSAGAK